MTSISRRISMTTMRNWVTVQETTVGLEHHFCLEYIVGKPGEPIFRQGISVDQVAAQAVWILVLMELGCGFKRNGFQVIAAHIPTGIS